MLHKVAGTTYHVKPLGVAHGARPLERSDEAREQCLRIAGFAWMHARRLTPVALPLGTDLDSAD
jgi:hypothetical protein